MAVWEKSKFESVILIDLFLHYWFFINLQMSTEWEFTFLNTTLIVFCLIYSLHIPHSNQNPSFFPAEGSVSISSKLTFRRHFTIVYCYSKCWRSHTKIILKFLFVWFYHCHRRRICVWFWWQIQKTMFIVSRLST